MVWEGGDRSGRCSNAGFNFMLPLLSYSPSPLPPSLTHHLVFLLLLLLLQLLVLLSHSSSSSSSSSSYSSSFSWYSSYSSFQSLLPDLKHSTGPKHQRSGSHLIVSHLQFLQSAPLNLLKKISRSFITANISDTISPLSEQSLSSPVEDTGGYQSEVTSSVFLFLYFHFYIFLDSNQR